MHDEAVVCVKCGVPTGKGNKFCNHCGVETNPEAVVCVQCGCSFAQKEKHEEGAKSKLIAGLLGIFLGTLGIHNFYLGFTKRAIGQILLTTAGSLICGIGPVISFIWSLVEGIQYLTGSKNTDASGKMLKE